MNTNTIFKQDVEVVDVYIYVDPRQGHYNHAAALSEQLFGILTGCFSSGYMNNSKQNDRRIMVQGVLPGSEACSTGEIHIGTLIFFLLSTILL